MIQVVDEFNWDNFAACAGICAALESFKGDFPQYREIDANPETRAEFRSDFARWLFKLLLSEVTENKEKFDA